MLAEEVLAHECAVVGLVGLVLAVDRLLHDPLQDAVLVAREQRVPVRAPDQLDHVPARAAEIALEFLDDLAVAAHRAVQPLQVAVDDEDQVVELLARGEADRAQRLGLVHLAVAAEHPDLAVAGVGDSARVQVLEEARLVDRHQRPEAHRDRRELPEVGHQVRVRVRRQALAADLLADVGQRLLGEAPLEERAPVQPRRRVPLEVDEVAAVTLVRRVPEVVHPRADHRRQRRERREMPAEIAAVGRVVLVRAHHHRHRVPPDERTDALLVLGVARRARFEMRGDRVDVGSVGRERDEGPGPARLLDHPLEQEVRAFRPLAVDDRLEGVEPLARLDDIRVGRVVGGRQPCRKR